MADNDKVNVLMVDDQPAKLLSYEAILSELGENLIAVTSGKEALEQLLKKDIAIILMDVSMPEIDGFELAETIHQHPRFQRTAIIFISAVHMSDLDRLQGYQRGAVDYIAVPVIPELLRAKVAVFADLHRKTRQLEMMNQELRRLSVSLITAQDDERRRIARDLHDGLGQDLVAAKMMLDRVSQNNHSSEDRSRSVMEASGLVEHSLQQIRNLSHLLHPPLLDEMGLNSALHWYVDGLVRRSGIQIFVQILPSDFPRLAPEMETSAFRVIQESLTNVFRHSGARHAWLTLSKEPGRLLIIVRDDGRGVPPEISDFRPGSIGMGIGGIRERLKEFGGELRLTNSNPGTIFEAVIPFRAVALPSQPQFFSTDVSNTVSAKT